MFSFTIFVAVLLLSGINCKGEGLEEYLKISPDLEQIAVNHCNNPAITKDLERMWDVCLPDEKLEERCFQFNSLFNTDRTWFLAAWTDPAIVNWSISTNLELLLEARGEPFKIKTTCRSCYREGFFMFWRVYDTGSKQYLNFQAWRRTRLRSPDIEDYNNIEEYFMVAETDGGSKGGSTRDEDHMTNIEYFGSKRALHFQQSSCGIGPNHDLYFLPKHQYEERRLLFENHNELVINPKPLDQFEGADLIEQSTENYALRYAKSCPDKTSLNMIIFSMAVFGVFCVFILIGVVCINFKSTMKNNQIVPFVAKT